MIEASQNSRQSVMHLEILKNIHQILLDANLLGMDILIDHVENKGSSEVNREGEYNDMKSYVESIDIKMMNDLKDDPFLNQIISMRKFTTDLLNTVEDTISKIKKGQLNEEEMHHSYESMDKTKVSGIHQLKIIRAEVQKNIHSNDIRLNEMYDEMLKTMVFTFAFCISLLLFVLLPIAFFSSNSLTQINGNLESIALGIQSTNDDLSYHSTKLTESTSESAAAIQESISAMTEMGAMISQTSRNASITTNLSKSAMHDTENGLRTMEELVESMRSISESSDRLKEIIQIINDISSKTKVINDVVFKTQLLAVNASIEAARAGQHGKGFSVVANEVSSLASMSGTASNEINDLLRSSSTQVDEIIKGTSDSIHVGKGVADKTSTTFGQIAQAITEISEKIEDISAATKEQETGVSQTTSALREISIATSAANGVAQKNVNIGLSLQDHASELIQAQESLNLIVLGKSTSNSVSQKQTKKKVQRQKIRSRIAEEDSQNKIENDHSEDIDSISVSEIAKKIRSNKSKKSSESEDDSDKAA